MRDQRPYNVAYYASHRLEEIERVTRRQQATLAWLRELRQVPCMDCGGVFPPHVMDFDHRDPKTKSFNVMAGRALLKSRDALLAEIAKCDIVCANCHRVRTYEAFVAGLLRPPSFDRKTDVGTKEQMRGRLKNRRRFERQSALLRELRDAPCADCGGRFPWYAMQFDHRDPSSKVGNVPQMAARVSLRKLLEEIAKCDIVCTNCHRNRTFLQWQSRGCVVAVANDSSKVEVRVRLPSPAPEQLRLIEESATPYRYAA